MLKNFNKIEQISRPTEIPESGLLCDLLWSDPATGTQAFTPGVKTKGWGKNDRGTSHVFSQQIVKDFCERHNIDLILRGH